MARVEGVISFKVEELNLPQNEMHPSQQGHLPLREKMIKWARRRKSTGDPSQKLESMPVIWRMQYA